MVNPGSTTSGKSKISRRGCGHLVTRVSWTSSALISLVVERIHLVFHRMTETTNNAVSATDSELKRERVPVADPGFPQGGGAHSPGGANIQFCQIFPKTA